MKVFFDIGTNQFQGYDALAGQLGITDEWHKVFVEPNPEFVQSAELMGRINSIPNAKLIPAALCCDCGMGSTTMMAIENGYYMDQGSNIFRKDWIEQGRKAVEVSVVTFDEICKPYIDGEWYMKFDCEGCEWSCLPSILEKYHDKIRHLVVEFHRPHPSEGDIRQMISQLGISYQEWH
jgi:FkbM family methyltransferase